MRFVTVSLLLATCVVSSWGIDTHAVASDFTVLFDGPAHRNDVPVELLVDSNSNFYLVSWVYGGAATRWDIAAAKYAPNGTLLWSTAITGPGSKDDRAFDAKLDGAGNLYIAGYIQNSDPDMCVVKLNAFGQEQWRAINVSIGTDMAFTLDVDEIGNAYVGTSSNNNFVLAKCSGPGQFDWIRVLELGAVNDVEVASNGDVVAIGMQFDRLQVVRYDPNGSQIYLFRYQAPVSSTPSVGLDGDFDSQGNLIVGGSLGAGTASEALVIKLDVAGMEAWHQIFPRLGSADSVASVECVPSGGAIVSIAVTFGSLELLHIRADGGIIWNSAVEAVGAGDDGILTGVDGITLLKPVVTHFDDFGSFVWSHRFFSSNRASEWPLSIASFQGKSKLVAYEHFGQPFFTDCAITKLVPAVAPSSARLIFGRWLKKDDSVLKDRDGYFANLAPADRPGRHRGAKIEVEFEAPDVDFDSIKLIIESHAKFGSAIQSVEFFDFEAQQFQVVHESIITGSPVTNRSTLGNAQRFLELGTRRMLARYTWVQEFGEQVDFVELDQLALIVQ